jgi:N6-L-threonylcarbamoyladenine synthase
MIKLNYYSKKFNIENIVIGGGVAANRKLQTVIKCAKFHYYIPDKQFTGDNAAMIA